MNFLDLQKELNRRIHSTTSNPQWVEAMKVWINLGRKYIVSLNPNWDFLQVTGTVALTAGQLGPYALNAELVKLNKEEVFLTASHKHLNHMDAQRSGKNVPTTADIPTHFRLIGYKTLYLFPPPTAAVVTAEQTFTYEYIRTFNTDMVADGDSHLLPIHFEPILLDIAEALAWNWLRDSVQSDKSWGRALGMMTSHAPENQFLARLARNMEDIDKVALGGGGPGQHMAGG